MILTASWRNVITLQITPQLNVKLRMCFLISESLGTIYSRCLIKRVSFAGELLEGCTARLNEFYHSVIALNFFFYFLLYFWNESITFPSKGCRCTFISWTLMATPFNCVIREGFGGFIWTPTAIWPSGFYSISTGLLRRGGIEIGFGGADGQPCFCHRTKSSTGYMEWKEKTGNYC